MDDVSASLRDMFIILPQFGSRLIQGSEFGRDKAETVSARIAAVDLECGCVQVCELVFASDGKKRNGRDLE